MLLSFFLLHSAHLHILIRRRFSNSHHSCVVQGRVTFSFSTFALFLSGHSKETNSFRTQAGSCHNVPSLSGLLGFLLLHLSPFFSSSFLLLLAFTFHQHVWHFSSPYETWQVNTPPPFFLQSLNLVT